MDTITVLIIGLAVAVAVLGYQVNQLREANGRQLARKVKNELNSGKPIDVKHDTPRSLTPDGKECWGAEKKDFDFFRAFWFFADAINSNCDSIRLQELKETLITSNDSPKYGRRYDIFFNRIKIGRLEIHADFLNDTEVHVDVTIHFSPREIAYEEVVALLNNVAGLIASRRKASIYTDDNGKPQSEYAYAVSRIRSDVLYVLMQIQREDGFFRFETHLSGTPEVYYEVAKREAERRMADKATAFG